MDWLKFEQQHLKNISKAERSIRQEFKRFYIKLESLIEQGYPERVIMRMVEREVKKLEKALQTTTTNAMSLATTQSVYKNALLLKSFGLDSDGLERIKVDLSPNIWKSRENLIDPIRNALKSGLSAADLAKEIVGDINTTHKGRGVYKEPVKNAMRVARTEINTTYHKNDDLIWSSQPMVLGKEIRLSNSPKKKARCWMCKGMAGKYPKEFMWTHWHPQCYSDDSMVMTKRGWLLFKDLLPNDLIFSLNPKTNVPEYVSINMLMVKEFKGEMIHFNSHNLDVLVTPDHPMKYLNKHKGEWAECEAKDFTMGKGSIYRASEWDGLEKESITIGKYTIDFDLFCEFMAYYLSDGSVAFTRQNQIHIAQFKDKSPIPYAKIKNCLSKMPFKANEAISGWYINDNCFYEYLKQFGYSHDKYVPKEILNSSKRQVNIFLSAYVLCDGSHRVRSKTFINSRGVETTLTSSQRQFYTSSVVLAKDLMELILKGGKRPSFSIEKPRKVKHHNGEYTAKNDLYRIYELNSKTSSTFRKDLVEYDGLVYDIELEKNHIMYISRNGKCFWGSNCLCSQIPILMTDEQFRLWEDGKLDPIPYVKLGQDKVNWVNENSYKWANWKEPPRWLVNFEELNKS